MTPFTQLTDYADYRKEAFTEYADRLGKPVLLACLLFLAYKEIHYGTR